MKTLLLFPTLLGLGCVSWAQTCTSSVFTYNVPIPDADPAGVTVNLAVMLPGNLGQQYVLDSVHVSIDHTYVGDVKALLVTPAGDTAVLFDQPGVPASTYGCGNDDIEATFTDGAALYAEDVCNAFPALSGKYKPITPLAGIQNGSISGTWTFTAADMAGSDIGTLDGVTLYFTPLWYTDADGDSYGAGNGVRGCSAPANHVPLLGDCNDAAANIHPGAIEICGNKIDEDCNGPDADYLYQPLLSTPESNGFCAGDSALIIISPFSAGDSVIWYYNQNVLSTQTGNYLYATQPGNYTAYIVMANGCYYEPNILQVTEYPLPQPTISSTGQGLYAGSYQTYTWLLDGNAISGANDPYWVPQSSGSYQVAVTDSQGCTGVSAPFSVANASVTEQTAQALFIAYPNPTTDGVYIQSNQATGMVELLDVQGKSIRKVIASQFPYRLGLEGIAPGIYVLKLDNHTQRLIIR